MKFLLACFVTVGLSWAGKLRSTSNLVGLSCDCGRRNSGRIVGGKETKSNDYPWIVSLSNGCGGSIITPWHVLTAAHCTEGETARSIKVTVGIHYKSEDKGKNRKIYSLGKIIQHERYDDQNLQNDISVLVTATEISFNQNVGPICLPNKKVDLVGTYIKIIGWGMTMGTGSENALREVDIKVIPYSQCKKDWTQLSPPGKQLCLYEPKKNPCMGDSGGPLVYLDKETNRYIQAALVSFGDENCNTSWKQKASVNTDVFAYLEWINKAISSSKPSAKVCSKFRLGRSALLFRP